MGRHGVKTPGACDRQKEVAGISIYGKLKKWRREIIVVNMTRDLFGIQFQRSKKAPIYDPSRRIRRLLGCIPAEILTSGLFFLAPPPCAPLGERAPAELHQRLILSSFPSIPHHPFPVHLLGLQFVACIPTCLVLGSQFLFQHFPAARFPHLHPGIATAVEKADPSRSA